MAFLLRMRKPNITLFLYRYCSNQRPPPGFQSPSQPPPMQLLCRHAFFLYVPFGQWDSGFSKNKAAGEANLPPYIYKYTYITTCQTEPELPISDDELNPPPFHSSVWSEEPFPSVSVGRICHVITRGLDVDGQTFFSTASS